MTATLSTDYLIVGSGAVGMAFADVLIAETDADVVIVDRFAKPGDDMVIGGGKTGIDAKGDEAQRAVLARLSENAFPAVHKLEEYLATIANT